VHGENPDVKAAIDENNERAEAVVAALGSMGIAANDIRTTHFNVFPSQQYTPEGELKGTTFIVDNAVYVTLRDLDRIGDVLEGAVEAGANNISGIQFDVADKDAALAEARQSAVAIARDLAEELAAAAGVTLGQIQSINYFGGGVPPLPLYEARGGGGMDMAAASVPISTGQLTFTVDVNVVYAIQ
jgi:uncharacterized protein YggE